jgi:signal transduction histidine kinase
VTASFEADQKNENLVVELDQHRIDLHEINERLHALVERQSMTLEERDALIAAVSHDLRSPLAAMSLMSQTLAQRGSEMSTDQIHEMAGRISADAQLTVEVLADLASAQRLKAQDVLANRTVVDLEALVTVAVAHHQSEEHHVRVGELALGGVDVTADRVLVGRILDNLVSNALKHTPDGSTIVVGATRVGDEVLLHVDDDGPGLPETLRESVFDAYVRGVSSTVRPGSGVGLFLVRTFAQLHGGRAWWEPSPIGGSRFVVSLPQAGVRTVAGAAAQ